MSCECLTLSSYWEWDGKYFFESEDLAGGLISGEVDFTKRSGSEDGANSVFTADKQVGDVNVSGHECFSNLS